MLRTRQSLPDLALELSMEGISLYERTAPGQWVALGSSRLDAPNLAADLGSMRALAGSKRGHEFRTQIWLPDEQLSVHNLLLGGATEKEREQAARDALSAITPHSGDDFAVVLGAPTLSGYTPVAGVLLQTLKEARVFAQENGFRPVGFSARETPSGFDFTPAFQEPVDYGPLRRKAAFAAGLAVAFLAGAALFRIIDPYQMWVPPPQVSAQPERHPGTQSSTGIAAVRIPSFVGYGSIAARRDIAEAKTRAAHLPPVSPATRPSRTLVATRPPAAAPSTDLANAAPARLGVAPPEIGTPPSLIATTADVELDRTGPEVQQRLKSRHRPFAALADTDQPQSPSPDSKPAAEPFGQLVAISNPLAKLPGPPITHAFPLNNLQPIMAAAKSLGAAGGVFTGRAGTNPSLPTVDVAFVAAARPTAPAAPAPPQTAHSAQPDIGPMAAMRPSGRPTKRPADLRTEGEFERAVETPAAPKLALTVPADILRALEGSAPSGAPPKDPLQIVTVLSSSSVAGGAAMPPSPDLDPRIASPASPAAAPLGQLAVKSNGSPKLPGPTITHAFPLNNLQPIIAAARSLGAAGGVFTGRIRPNPSLPTLDVAFAVAAGPAVPSAPAPPQTAHSGMPSIGPMAAMRPSGKPTKRPADLRTEGDFQRAVDTPDTPRLALTVPAEILRSLDTPALSDTPPKDPLQLLTVLSSNRLPVGRAMPSPPEPDLLTAPLALPVALDIQPTRELAFAAPPPAGPVAVETASLPPVQIADDSVFRPRPRPGQPAKGEVKSTQDPAGGADRFASLRPKHRPKSVQRKAEESGRSASKLVLAKARAPKARPATLELKAAAYRRAHGAGSASTIVQRQPVGKNTKIAALPTKSLVQRAATIKHGFNRNRISLMGIYGTPSKRRALIRMPGGQFVRVTTGDKFHGYQVASIGTDYVKLLRSGRSETLKMPKQ